MHSHSTKAWRLTRASGTGSANRWLTSTAMLYRLSRAARRSAEQTCQPQFQTVVAGREAISGEGGAVRVDPRSGERRLRRYRAHGSRYGGLQSGRSLRCRADAATTAPVVRQGSAQPISGQGWEPGAVRAHPAARSDGHDAKRHAARNRRSALVSEGRSPLNAHGPVLRGSCA